MAGHPSEERVRAFVARAAAPLTGDASLPIFSAVPDRGALRKFVAELAGDVPAQAIYLGRERWRRRAPLELPIDIVGVGPGPGASLERIAESDWLRLATPTAAAEPELLKPGALRTGLRARPRDVVIAGTGDAVGVLAAVGTLPSEFRPRLILVLGLPGEERPKWLDELVPAHGVAVAYVAAQSGEEGVSFAAGVLKRIAGDLPLHDAVRLAARASGPDVPLTPDLVADPGTNESLSLQAKAHQMLDLANEASEGLATSPRPVFMNVSVGRLRERFGGLRRPFLRFFVEPEAEYEYGYGLPDLADAAEVVEEAERVGEEVRAAALVADPVEWETAQVRRVDLAVRANRSSITEALAPSLRFRVLLRIGRPFHDSRLQGDAPPVAAALPDPEAGGGHDLDVVVYGLDFRVQGKIAHAIHLPRVGPSRLLSVPVLAPAKECEQARMRLAIYWGSHLVQSFLMVAAVREDRRGEPPVFRLEFAQTERFANLDDLQPRLVSIAANADPGGSHTLMVKGKGEATGVELNAAFITTTLEKFRTTLTATSRSITTGRAPPSADPDPSTEFVEQWWDLAWLGSKIYQEFWSRFDEAKLDLLDKVRAAADDEVIQVIRLDPSFAFPWPLLYDWDLPDRNEGDPPPPLCLGGPPAADDDAAVPPRTCGHGPGSEAFCVYGFWGVRLRLEQLVENAGGADAPIRIAGTCPLRLGLGVLDPGTTGLDLRLAAITTVSRVKGTTSLIDDLWEPHWRPAELIAIGHHAEVSRRAEPLGSRIQLDGRWLVMTELAKRLRRSFWETPNSIVLLLGCDTGTAAPIKLDDFAWHFLKARAGGVLATEVAIRTDLAARCAYVVTRALFTERQTFSVAVRDLHRRLAQAGNPLGFAFVNLGHAELHVAS
ncbi:MAG: hypothetical protein ACR2KV_13410 [Solirubrobacteraceae bacterium]